MTIEVELQENNELLSDEDFSLWRICSHCEGDGCACCEYDGLVYDPEPDGTN